MSVISSFVAGIDELNTLWGLVVNYSVGRAGAKIGRVTRNARFTLPISVENDSPKSISRHIYFKSLQFRKDILKQTILNNRHY